MHYITLISTCSTDWEPLFNWFSVFTTTKQNKKQFAYLYCNKILETNLFANTKLSAFDLKVGREPQVENHCFGRYALTLIIELKRTFVKIKDVKNKTSCSVLYVATFGMFTLTICAR